jgi:hypothetical protein
MINPVNFLAHLYEVQAGDELDGRAVKSVSRDGDDVTVSYGDGKPTHGQAFDEVTITRPHADAFPGSPAPEIEASTDGGDAKNGTYLGETEIQGVIWVNHDLGTVPAKISTQAVGLPDIQIQPLSWDSQTFMAIVKNKDDEPMPFAKVAVIGGLSRDRARVPD